LHSKFSTKKNTKKIQKLFFFSPLQNHRFQFFKKPSQTPFFFPPLYFSFKTTNPQITTKKKQKSTKNLKKKEQKLYLNYSKILSFDSVPGF